MDVEAKQRCADAQTGILTRIPRHEQTQAQNHTHTQTHVHTHTHLQAPPHTCACTHTHTHTDTHTHRRAGRCFFRFHTFSLSSARLSVSSCPARSSSLVACSSCL